MIENQLLQGEKLDDDEERKVSVFVEPITKIEEIETDNSKRKSKRLRGEKAAELKEEENECKDDDWRYSSDSDDDFKPFPKQIVREKDPEHVKRGVMGAAALRRKKRLRKLAVRESFIPREKSKEPKKEKKEPQESKRRIERAERDTLIQKYFPNKCEECGGIEFKTFSELTRHSMKEHGARKHYTCCGAFLSTGMGIYQHCLEHENPIQCNYCGMVCLSKVMHSRHLLEAHGISKRPEEENPYECHLCHRRYADKKKIENHMERAHLTPATTYVCETCARPYRTAASLKIHIRRDHLGEKLPKSQCPHCGKWILNTGLPFHIRKHMEPKPTEKFKCDKCGSQHTQYHGLLKHVKRHHSELSNRYQCPQCPKGFFNKHCFDEHFAVHTGETLYHCEFCDAGFKSCGNFLAHKRKLHPVLYAQQKLANKLKREEKARPH